ncbi:DUF1490 family protein [Jongsikchunia kroppenstedtii]|uniref:DUF1490 family protein n=1 Tax=Jongsikchunia kroppenstedtii TaxID=1121721 RepID=UPI0003709FD3|nr:DUF1490 family protein [Jongsikchunia kroppenstedtii]
MTGLVHRTVAVVATGLTGAVAYDGVKALSRKLDWRSAAVRATELTIVGTRHLETRAEELRLAAGDIVAEARERVGEETPPPAAAGSADHDHDH